MKITKRGLEDLLSACHEIVDDFYSYGVVLQADDDNEYGDTSGIGKLINAVNAIEGGKP